MPVAKHYHPDPRHIRLGGEFFDAVAPAAFPQTVLRFRNDRWAARIGLESLNDAEWIAHFARFEPLPGNLSEPLALRYHGHQFRSYNPDLGDGRGFLFAQVRDNVDDRLLDLGTKGSGQTPWSRAGDGRLTLKGGVREVLATEMLEALGVYTSKSFSLIETGEALMRGDEPSPTRSSVLVRLSHSHVRIGSFQRLTHRGDAEGLRTLIDYCIDTYWPQAQEAEDRVAALFSACVQAIAYTAAEWFVAGFVHGVLNTDNAVITGESFDYGPWRFLPILDPNFTAAYFDETGLYAFGRQPSALAWNLERLAACLLPFSDEASLVAALQDFGAHFNAALMRRFAERLGLAPQDEERFTPLISRLLAAMRDERVPFEQCLFDLFGLQTERLSRSPLAAHYASSSFAPVIAELAALPRHPALSTALNDPYFAARSPVTLLFEDVEALWTPIAERDDWAAFHAKIAAIRAMGAAYAPLFTHRNGFAPLTGQPRA